VKKTYWADRNALLDPETEFAQIYRNLTLHEFPWDLNQALSFALFRTYAVPSIGNLLNRTGEFTQRVQKRYDDTALLLEAPLVHGFSSIDGKAGIKRVNQMHKMYDISNDDMRYVLATFVVVPKRWIDDYGWRKWSDGELRASVNYYRELGRHLAIQDVPETYDEFAELMDAYEADHFAYDRGARRVADSTMRLMTTFYPKAAAKGVDVFSRALMDEPLLAAFRFADPGPAARRVSRGALRARARLLAHLPPRRKPRYIKDLPRIRSYPAGYELTELGTFAPGCPVPHDRAGAG
jgi:hypothetical protein